MTLDMPSFGVGIAVAAFVAYAWYQGRMTGIREARRIARHGRALDYVYFEDAEADPTTDTPKPVQAGVMPFQRERG